MPFQFKEEKKFLMDFGARMRFSLTSPRLCELLWSGAVPAMQTATCTQAKPPLPFWFPQGLKTDARKLYFFYSPLPHPPGNVFIIKARHLNLSLFYLPHVLHFIYLHNENKPPDVPPPSNPRPATGPAGT